MRFALDTNKQRSTTWLNSSMYSMAHLSDSTLVDIATVQLLLLRDANVGCFESRFKQVV